MINFILVFLHILACLFLIIFVLLQAGKSADLAGAFGGGGSQTAFGSRTAGNFLTKMTTTMAVIFMLTCLVLSLRYNVSSSAGNSAIPIQDTRPAAVPVTAGQPTAKPKTPETPPVQSAKPVGESGTKAVETPQPSSAPPAPAPK